MVCAVVDDLLQDSTADGRQRDRVLVVLTEICGDKAGRCMLSKWCLGAVRTDGAQPSNNPRSAQLGRGSPGPPVPPRHYRHGSGNIGTLAVGRWRWRNIEAKFPSFLDIPDNFTISVILVERENTNIINETVFKTAL